MTYSICLNKKDWNDFKRCLERRLEGAKYSVAEKSPLKFPCLVVSQIMENSNGYVIDSLFFYEDTGKLLCLKQK